MIQFRHDRPGPGIDPNAPKKTGIAWFFDIIYREFWPLLWLNLWFLMYCVPIFTIGPAIAGMYTVLIRMLRDQPVDVAPEFRKAFRDNFKAAFLMYVLQIVMTILLVWSWFFYGAFSSVLQMVVVSIAFLCLLLSLYVYPMMVSVELTLPQVLKNSFFLLYLNWKKTLIMVSCWLITVLIIFLFAHVYMIGFAFFQPVFLGLILCFCAYEGIEKYCYQAYVPPEKEKKEPKLSEFEKEMAELDAELEALEKDE